MSKRVRISVLAMLLIVIFTLSSALSVIAGGITLKITKQPTDVFGTTGATVSTTVEAQGNGLSYQWYVKDVGSETFSRSAIKSNRYVYQIIEEKDGRQVYCVITDSSGNSVRSDTATFRISNLKITKQPMNAGGPIGSIVSVSVEAEGEGLSYQWFEKDLGSTDFIETSVIEDNYTCEMTEEISGRQIYCVVSDNSGNSMQTNTVVIEIADMINITKQPVNVFGAVDATLSTAVEAEGNGLSYQWYVKDITQTEFVKSSIKSNRYTYKMTAEKVGRQVYCTVTDKYGNCINSQTVTFGTSSLKITKHPHNAGGAVGTNVATTVEAEGEGLTYQWYVKDVGKTDFTKSSIKSNRYVYTMTEAKSGRQVYCIVTDNSGNSVKSNIAVLGITAALKITEQPVGMDVPSGAKARSTLTAEGEGLTYQWFVKDTNQTEFTKSTVKSNDYVYTMTEAKAGRQAYCVITDSSGVTVQSETVTFGILPSLEIIKQPTDIGGPVGSTASTTVTATGVGLKYRWYYRNAGETDFIPSNVTTDTYKVEVNKARDSRQIYCVITDAFGFKVKTETVTINVYKYYITQDLGNGKTQTVGVPSNGNYILKEPGYIGYDFIGWETAEGENFADIGTIDGDITVFAKWEIKDTNSLEELVALTNSGADTIKITNDITVNRPIYISYSTKIYSDDDYTIKRAPDYDGDIFVVGRDENEIMATMHHRKAVLTLGGGKGTLTIDGNKDNLNVTVVGSAVFVSDSATLNMYDGVRIVNNKKLGNERVFLYDYIATWMLERAGGAAIININATVNMYGGELVNNEVKTESTLVVDEEGVESYKEIGGCGGAIFNKGNFNMYGGAISGNTALRGGAVYNDRYAFLNSGEISDNYSYSYGGAVSSSSSSDANLFFGTKDGENTILISGNHSVRAGGAVYSSTTSPIIVYGNAIFDRNSTDSSGGALYSAGHVIAYNTVFRNNTAQYSGGVIYHHYSNLEYTNRTATFEGCHFENNSASLGGVMVASASQEVTDAQKGTEANITNCTFVGNYAFAASGNPGNGGAIYATRNAKVAITDCDFERNTAQQSGGAVSIHSGAKVTITNCTLTENTAANGGALYVSSNVSVKLNGLTLSNNKAQKTATGGGGNGGALYANISVPTLNNISFENNYAENNGGAFYQLACDVVVNSDCQFVGNTAGGHGGAVYMTYQTLEDGTKDGSVLTANNVLFKENTASAGGAISVRTDCEVVMNNAQLIGNTVIGEKADAAGGGVIYVGYGTATLNNVTATGNSSAGFGGVVNSVDSTVTVKDGTFEENTAPSGGVINAIDGSVVSVTNATLRNNQSPYDNTEYNNNIGGGAINISGGTLTLTNAVLDGNKSDYYGGALLTNNTTVLFDGGTVKNSRGGTGAALFFKGGSAVTIKDTYITDNIATNNGVVYANSGTMTLTNVTATGNKAYNGGVLYVSGGTNTITDSTFTDNTATNNGGVISLSGSAKVTVTNSTFSGNKAANGGAVYAMGNAKATLNESTFSANTSSNGGSVHITETANVTLNGGTVENHTCGAIWTDSGTTTLNNVTATNNNAGVINARDTATVNVNDSEFTANSAIHGAAIFASNADVNLSGNTFKENTVTGNGGAIYIQGAIVTSTGNNVFENNTAAGHGGAIYVSYTNNEDGTKTPGVVNMSDGSFVGNKALAGGAVSIRTSCEATFNGTSFTENSVEGYADKNDGDGEGGGVIYVGFGTVNLNNVTATNNTAGLGGVVDSMKSTVNITGGTYSGNSASSGGVIYALSGSTVTVNGATMSNNESTDANTGYNTNIGGGAVNMFGGKLTVTNTVLDGNKTGYYGGAVLADNATVVINENSKVSNSAGATGAALYFKGSCSATIDNSEISDNTASSNGVVYVNSGTLNVTNATVKGNKANAGGLLYISGGKATLTNVTATENTATNGGVIYSSGGSSVNVIDCSMDTNTATNGGVVYLTGKPAVTVDGGTYQNNIAKNGGVVNGEGGIFTAQNATFKGNTATQHGGALYLYGTQATLKDNTFIESTANKNGGAIYISGSTVTAEGSNAFENNSAVGHGGAIYVSYTNNDDGTKTPGIVNMSGGSFVGNKAMAGGAVSIRTSCEATFDGTTFTENSVEGYEDKNDGNGEGGGVIYVGFGTVNLNNVTATNNTAGLGGVVDAYDAVVNITGGTYSGNSASSGGVVYALSGSAVTVNGATMSNNESTDSTVEGQIGGGAVNISGGSITITNTVFDGNKTAYYGGAINARAATVVINGNSIVRNSTGATGAALYFRDGIKATIENATIENNTSRSNGVVYVNSGTMTLTNVTATGNKAYNGGVLYVSGGTNTITDSTFTDNTATNNGGVISLSGSAKVTVTNSTFSGNKAANGGAVYAMGNAKATLNESTFSANTSSNGGSVHITETANVTLNGGTVENHTCGAIWTDSGTTTLNNVTATNNNAGVINARDTATVNVNDSEFTANSAIHGAAIFASNADVNLSGNTFKENTVTGNGGAIYIQGAIVTSTGNNVFENNTAAGHGGAIYVSYTNNEDGTKTPGVVNMSDGSFVGNKALAGGAVSIRTSCEATFNGTSFTENSVEGYADKNDGDGEGGGVIYVGFGTVNLNNVTATNNTAGLGGVVDSMKSTVNITGGTYSGNSASSGGVIYALSGSTVTVNGATMSNNESTDANTGYNTNIGGGAVNMFGGKLTVTNTVLDGNKTGYYGGAVLADNATVVINENSKVSNSAGATGAALYFKGSCSATIDNSEISDNTASSNGVVYVNSGTLNVTNATVKGNKANAGGLLYISGGKATLTNVTATENTATNGGVIYTTSKVQISGSTLVQNSATKKGGAVYGTGNANITITDNSKFNANTAPTAGAIYLDQGATATISDSVFDGNTATGGDGGAVVVADSSEDGTAYTKLVLNSVTFQNNTASAKGGAISTDTASPNLIIDATNCVFNANKALGAGGGAVEIQNANCKSETEPTEVTIVFTGCTFIKNTCKTTGAAIEIRSNSCAKFDSITATENKATGVGGVIYVTSNYSRLYLTGTVSLSGNTSSDSSFINLYNASYTCPPKIYTTHSSSAGWYSLVKGNKTSIVFDLTELP